MFLPLGAPCLLCLHVPSSFVHFPPDATPVPNLFRKCSNTHTLKFFNAHGVAYCLIMCLIEVHASGSEFAKLDSFSKVFALFG